MKMLFLILGIAFVLSWVPALAIFLRSRSRFSGRRIVRCPETRHPAAICLDASHAAATSLTGEPELRVGSCNRWAGPVGHCFDQCVSEPEPGLLARAGSAPSGLGDSMDQNGGLGKASVARAR